MPKKTAAAAATQMYRLNVEPRVIDHLAKLNGELSGHDNDLARLVEKSAIVFRQFASQERNISGTVRRFPPALRETTRTLGKVRVLADTLRPAVGRLEPAIRSLTAANRVVAPSARAVTPVLRDQIRPFTRDAQPLVRELRAPAAKLSEATGDFTRVGVVLNHLFNMVAYNPNGREGPDVKNRDEGYLFWLAWLGHQSVQIFNASDAHGTFRAVTVAFPCPFIKPAELLQLPFVLFFEWFNLRVRTDEIVRRGEVRVFDVRDLPSEHAQIGLRAFELAQHFFLVPVPHHERDARSGDTGHKNDDRDDRVSPNSLLINRLRHSATEAYRVFPGLQNNPSTILHHLLSKTNSKNAPQTNLGAIRVQ